MSLLLQGAMFIEIPLLMLPVLSYPYVHVVRHRATHERGPLVRRPLLRDDDEGLDQPWKA